MTEYISHSLEETRHIAEALLKYVSEKNIHVIALQGDLGAGKTALTKCIAELMGITETVTSPTFVIMKKYPGLVHVDAYRLQSAHELEVLDFKKELDNQENLIIIEWPEQVPGILPPETLTVQCNFIDENTRKYSF